jgi:hypothetical protein
LPLDLRPCFPHVKNARAYAGFFSPGKKRIIVPYQLLQILLSAGRKAAGFASALTLAMGSYQIHTRLHMAAFIAQVSRQVNSLLGAGACLPSSIH